MQNVLLISPYYPKVVPSGSSVRLAKVVCWLANQGLNIHFVHATRKSLKQPPACDMPIESMYFLPLAGQRFDGPCPVLLSGATRPSWSLFGRWGSRDETVTEQIHALIDHHQIDTVWVDHTEWAPLIRGLSPKEPLLRILDTHDVLYTRDATLVQQGLPPSAGLNRHQERELLQPFDIVIAIQEAERELLQDLMPEKRVITVGHAISTTPQSCSRPSVCFVGSRYEANEEALDQFATHAWPRIRSRCPEAVLEVAGGVCVTDSAKKAVRQSESVRLLGIVPETRDIYDGPAVVVCPLNAGSGLKIKMVEALAYGKATVASPVAAQGLEEGANDAFCLARTRDEFVESVTKILKSEDLRRELEKSAAAFATRNFSERCVWAALHELLIGNEPLRATQVA